MKVKTSSKSKSKSKDKLAKDKEDSEHKEQPDKERNNDNTVSDKNSKKEIEIETAKGPINAITEDFKKGSPELASSYNYSYYDQLSKKNTITNIPSGRGHGVDSMNVNSNMGRNFERCDGCYDGEGICFCVTCEKIYCKICEEQIHIVPSYRNHERVPIGDVYHLKKLCYHHSNPLKFYCESCEEPICQECQKIGPHNSKLHRITTVIESFKKKFNYVNNLVQKNLLSKYDQLTGQIQYMEFLIDEVKTVKDEIERDIHAEYMQMIDRLRSEEGKKLAVLQYENSLLQNELNKIHDIISVINDTNSNESPDMITFLLKFKQINDNVEFCLSKQVNHQFEINTQDLPRELDEKKAKLERYEKLKKLVKVKDDIIWNLLTGTKDKLQTGFYELREKTKNEQNSDYSKLPDRYGLEKASDKYDRYGSVKEYKIPDRYSTDQKSLDTRYAIPENKRQYSSNLVCSFCGCQLDETNVNTACLKNTHEEKYQGHFCEANPPLDVVSTKRHFFAQPSKEYEAKLKSSQTTGTAGDMKSSFGETKTTSNPFERNILNESRYGGGGYSSSLNRGTSPRSNLRYSDSTQNQKPLSHDWVIKVASIAERGNVNFYTFLSEYDLDGDGYVKPEDIRCAFSKLQVNLDSNDIENMLRYFNLANLDVISVMEFSKNFMKGSSVITSK